MTRPLLSATLICRDEAHNVTRCLDSIAAHVDEIVVMDTGSTDHTIAEFKKYAAKHKFPKGKLKIGHFDWCDDFAAARQAADDLATGEFLVWADLDDEVIGLDKLREYAARASDDVVAFFAHYTYACDPDGNAISELWRERLVRNNGTPWTGRLHEHKLVTQGSIVKVDPNVARWVHHRDHEQRTGDRNLRVLQAWLADEPDNPRIVQSIAMEYMGQERHKDASDTFAQFLEMPGEPPDRRAQATRYMCQMLLMQDRVAEARAGALRSLQETWLWADTHLTLAEADQTMGRPQEAIVHARTAMEIGKPDTLLIVNPLQYTAHPRALMAICMAQLGQAEEAVDMMAQALAIAPSYPLALATMPKLHAARKKHLAVGSILALGDSLVEAGELRKARSLLDCAPWYVTDDERLVRRRGEISGEIDRRMATSATPADEAADAFVKRHMEMAA